MARNNGGVFGQLRGKIGDVVFSVSRGVQNSRRYQPVVNNPKSVKQEQQRSLFADSVAFVQKQCRYAIANVLKKKYTGTTAYAQLVGSSLSLLRMNEFPSAKSRETFEKSWISKSSLGYGISDIVDGLKTANGKTFFASRTTGQVYAGLSVPLDFFEGIDLESYEMKLRAIEVRRTQGGGDELVFIPTSGDWNTGVYVSKTNVNREELRVVDGVVQPACGLFNLKDDTHAQYAAEIVIEPTGQIWMSNSSTEVGTVPILDFVDAAGNAFGGNGLYYWLEDTLGNVWSARTKFTSTILPTT